MSRPPLPAHWHAIDANTFGFLMDAGLAATVSRQPDGRWRWRVAFLKEDFVSAKAFYAPMTAALAAERALRRGLTELLAEMDRAEIAAFGKGALPALRDLGVAA